MNYREAKMLVAQRLKDAGIENEVAESGFLMEFACKVNRNFYLLHQMDEISDEHKAAWFALTEQRCRHIPLQYLTGEQEFMGLEFYVTSDVLIPRQDTEVLVEHAIEKLRETRGNKVLDLCTGSGCIGISIKSFCSWVDMTGSDVSVKALQVAKENAVQNHMDVKFVESDLFSNLTDKYDMIVSNPPYIPSAVIPTLMPEVREHEPVSALDGMEDGLYFYDRIVRESVNYLNPQGWLMFEIGYNQGKAVSDFMKNTGFTDIQVITDLAGLDRVVIGRRM